MCPQTPTIHKSSNDGFVALKPEQKHAVAQAKPLAVATSVWGLNLLVYEQKHAVAQAKPLAVATSEWGLKLLVYEALS
jgi:hypothetical protein